MVIIVNEHLLLHPETLQEDPLSDVYLLPLAIHGGIGWITILLQKPKRRPLKPAISKGVITTTTTTITITTTKALTTTNSLFSSSHTTTPTHQDHHLKNHKVHSHQSLLLLPSIVDHQGQHGQWVGLGLQ